MKDTFNAQFEALFPPGEDYNEAAVRIIQADDRLVEIKYGRMYEAPPLTLERLLEIGTLFGTKSVDVDNYGIGGCETCDYGSDYGHEIQVRQPTRNVEAAAEYMRKP